MASKVIVRTRIGLGFLGPAYKDCYIELKALPLPELPKVRGEIEAAKKSNEKAEKYALAYCTERFLGGKWKNEEGDEPFDLTKDDLPSFPASVHLKCLLVSTGSDPDPK